MIRYKMSTFDILEELKESFNYYSIDEINFIYEFIKRNETNVSPLQYDRENNRLTF
ncbi:MAG: hypothetical protein V1913_03435 [Fibrobacterota bacterium]